MVACRKKYIKLKADLIEKEKMDRLEKGCHILFQVQKRWGNRELSEAFGEMRRGMIEAQANNVAERMIQKRFRENEQARKDAIERGDLDAAADLAGEAEDHDDATGKSLMEMLEEDRLKGSKTDADRQGEAAMRVQTTQKLIDQAQARIKELETTLKKVLLLRLLDPRSPTKSHRIYSIFFVILNPSVPPLS